jgi:hypothetical protein
VRHFDDEDGGDDDDDGAVDGCTATDSLSIQCSAAQQWEQHWEY